MEEKIFLGGSRGTGVHNDDSDYDYVMIDYDREGFDDYDVSKEYIDENSHCFHIPKNYLDRLVTFDVDDNSLLWLRNATHFKIGVSDVNPFDYIDIWKDKLKKLNVSGIEFYHINPKYDDEHKYKKRFYIVVYNYYLLKEGTFDLSPEAMEMVKKFHDKTATMEEYNQILEGIQNL